MYPKEIENRDDIYKLVATFYDKLKEDSLIGSIFTETILKKDWENHLQKLTDFWETNLFRISKFRGNPMQTHKQLDANFNFEISQNILENG